MATVQHPLSALLAKLNLTSADFSSLLGVSASEVSQILRGVRTRIPRRWQAVLEVLNIDYNEFNQQYLAWRIAHREEILRDIKNRLSQP